MATITPVRLPSTLPALVAPGLPDPTECRSMPRIRAMMAAGFTDPMA